jgi:hypothetical protein
MGKFYLSSLVRGFGLEQAKYIDLVKNMLDKYDFTFIDAVRPFDTITTSIKFASSGGSNFHISEFPGNCSVVVVHGGETPIQISLDRDESDMRYKLRENLIGFAEEIAKEAGYGGLMFTGTVKPVEEFFVSRGYTIIQHLYNPHSTNMNYFALKTFNQED